ncbi:MAG TPA: hypothetical protein VJ960_05090, partial [Oceanipulchritudo sp.]|nr:hypothetical protein [Oceanipulchritudo sp.]
MMRSCKLLLGLLFAGVAGGLAAQDEAPDESVPVPGEEEAASAAEAPAGEEAAPETDFPEGEATPAEGESEVAEIERVVTPVLSPAERAASLASGDGKVHVYRVPITEAISKPNLFILRRSIKQAIER